MLNTNMLDIKINDTNECLEFLTKVNSIIYDEQLQKLINEFYTEAFHELNTFPEDDFLDELKISSIYTYDYVNLSPLPLKLYHFTYEELCNKATLIDCNNEIAYYYEKEFEYKGIKFRIENTFLAKIPDDVMALLDSLGKVNVNYIEARTESNVFCSN